MDVLFIFFAQYLFVVIPLIALADFLKNRSYNKQRIALLGVLSGLFSFGIGFILGLFFYNPRPFVTYHFIPLIAHAANNGFPSDHTLFSALIASVVFSYNKRLGLLLELIAILVGISRIYVGIHSLIDVIGGLVITAVETFFAFQILKKKDLYGCDIAS